MKEQYMKHSRVSYLTYVNILQTMLCIILSTIFSSQCVNSNRVLIKQSCLVETHLWACCMNALNNVTVQMKKSTYNTSWVLNNITIRSNNNPSCNLIRDVSLKTNIMFWVLLVWVKLPSLILFPIAANKQKRYHTGHITRTKNKTR